MATDTIDGIYSRLFALFAARTAPGQFIALTKARTSKPLNIAVGNPWPTEPGIAHQAGELPQVIVDFTEQQWSPFTEDEHYGSYGTLASEAWVEPETITFTMSVKFKDERLVDANALFKEIKLTLRNAGPTLGLGYVERFGPVTRRDEFLEKEDVRSGGTRRRMMVVTIPVQTVQDGNTQLT